MTLCIIIDTTCAMSEYPGVESSVQVKNGLLRRVLFGICLSLFFQVQMVSASVIKNSAHFKIIGRSDSFHYAPASYSDATHPNPFFYDVFYYIPERLRDQSQVKAIVFNHGGGPSTFTRASSIDMLTGHYLRDLVNVADQMGVIVVLPSANGLNWNLNTVTLMRDLAAIIRTELNVDANSIGLAGHSMGGMGITRSYSMLADQFSFFMPMSSGMDLSAMSEDQAEWHLNKVFNVPYFQIQGLRDPFHEFVTRGQDQETKTKALEVKYGATSKLKMLFMDSDHSPEYEAMKIYAAKLFRESPRNLYQSELWGTLVTEDEWKDDNGTVYHLGSINRYFWVEARETDLTKSETINFHAKIESNEIRIDMPVMPVQTHKLRIYLSSKTLNLANPVTVYINQAKLATHQPNSTHGLEKFDLTDPKFIYDDFVDVVW